MRKKIYDSEETLKAGLKAEKETIVEYTKYLNEAKNAGNESEVKLWEHIIKDEQEHVKEFENALKGDFNLLNDSDSGIPDPDDEIVITHLSQEEVNARNEKIETFMDMINDVLVDNGIDYRLYTISSEDPHYYVDILAGEKVRKQIAEKAYEVLRDAFFKCDLVEDDGMYWVHILRR